MNPEVEVYVKELSKLRYGYPLYDPDPAESYDRVRIGDVGYVTDYGCFLRLFNVFYPKGHPINNLGVPDGFIPLDKRYQRSHKSQAIQPGVICSSHVRRLDASASLNGGVFPAGLSVRLSCADHQGAALVLKRRAVREDTICRKAFRDLMLRRHQSWYAFARYELQTDITMNDILLVTGHILTNEWATATVVEKTRNCEMRFNCASGLGTLGNASASVWGSWTSSVSLPLRFGPTSLPPSRIHNDSSSIPESSTYNSSLNGQLLVPQNLNLEDDIDPPPNQCIFVRGFRLLLKPPFFIRKIKAAAEPKDDDGRSMDQEKHSPLVVTVTSDYSEYENEIRERNLKTLRPERQNLYEEARDYILMNSDVDVVLLSDDDVFKFDSMIRGRSTCVGMSSTLEDANILRDISIKSEAVNGLNVGSFNFGGEARENSDIASPLDHLSKIPRTFEATSILSNSRLSLTNYPANAGLQGPDEGHAESEPSTLCSPGLRDNEHSIAPQERSDVPSTITDPLKGHNPSHRHLDFTGHTLPLPDVRGVLSSMRENWEKREYANALAKERKRKFVLGRVVYDGLVSMFYAGLRGLPWRGTTISPSSQFSNRMVPPVTLSVLQTKKSHDTENFEEKTHERTPQGHPLYVRTVLTSDEKVQELLPHPVDLHPSEKGAP